LGSDIDWIEDGATFHDNALIKARTLRHVLPQTFGAVQLNIRGPGRFELATRLRVEAAASSAARLPHTQPQQQYLQPRVQAQARGQGQAQPRAPAIRQPSDRAARPASW
jgi:hypothetical protein